MTKPSLFKVFNYDRRAMEDGQWVPFHGGEILVARLGMPRHIAAIRAAGELYRPDAGSEPLSVDQAEILQSKITTYGLAHGALLDWRGFEEPYSPETAIRLMENQPDAREEVYRIANNRETYRAKEMKEAAPNSDASSAG